MDIRDTETVNKVACGPCGYPVCPEAVVECQSITVQACGEQIPVNPALPPSDSRYVPAEDRCKIFKKVEERFLSETAYKGPSEEGSSTGGFRTEDRKCTFDYTWSTFPPEEEGDFPERSCGPGVTSSFTISEETRQYSGGELLYTITVNGSSSSSPGSACSGSMTIIQTNEGEEPGEPVIWPLGCECPPALDINGAQVVYTSPGTFTQVTVDPLLGGSTTNTWTRIFSEPVTVADLKAEATARAALYGDTHDWPGSACQTKVEFSHGYPIPPEGEEPDPEAESVCTQVQELTLARFRRGVPVGFSTAERPRTKFRERGEDWFFPAVWDAWDAALGLYEQWEKEHAAWVAGGGVGIEPVEPPEPGNEPEEKPRLVLEWEWTWSGTMANRFSNWFIRELPEDVETAGIVRSVNVATWCYNSARTGTLPTFHGEIYVPDDGEGEP